MARPNKQGIDYYNVETDIFTNRKIRRLIKTSGSKGFLIYMYVLTQIYKENGCFLQWDENTAFDVADYLNFSENLIEEVLKSCCNMGLFDKALFDNENIITSKNIQIRWETIVANTRRNIRTVQQINKTIDLTKEQKSTKEQKIVYAGGNRVYAGGNRVNAGENRVNAGGSRAKTKFMQEETPQSKVKESKVKKSKVNKSNNISMCKIEILPHERNENKTDFLENKYQDQVPTPVTQKKEEEREKVPPKKESTETDDLSDFHNPSNNIILPSNESRLETPKNTLKQNIQDRAKDFKLKIWEKAKGTAYENPEILRDFWEYWSEHGENDRKMRYEKQTSFSIERRLSMWFRKEEEAKQKQYGKSNGEQNCYEKSNNKTQNNREYAKNNRAIPTSTETDERDYTERF